MTRIFVSYRRDDTEGEAGRLADRLIARFGADSVFYDRESLRPGDPWRRRIDAALAGCECMLLLIGPRWESLAGADGRRRLFNTDDVAAYEVASALRRGIRLVPLLVRRQELPATADLPPGLVALRESQAPVLHADAFGPIVEALIESLEPAASPAPRPAFLRRQSAWLWAGAGVGTLAVALFVFRPQPGPEPTPVAAAPQNIGQLRVRVLLAPDAPGESPILGASGQNVLMAIVEPFESKIELPTPAQARERELEFVLERALLPLPGQRFEADLTRRVQSAHSSAPRRTTLCLQRTLAAPADGLQAVMACEEGQRCKAAADNPGHFVASCNPLPAPLRKTSGLDWLALPSAQARAALPPPAPTRVLSAPSLPGAGVEAASATPDRVWSIPSIETLRQRNAAGAAGAADAGGAGVARGAFAEIELISPPLPSLRAARRVSLELTVNNQPAWIDGLPPHANSFPFDAEQGLRLQFGLENLGFSGARSGTEQLSLRLRFLDGKAVLRVWQADLSYVALRPQPKPQVVGDPELGISWTARYHPGSADRWQVFLSSTRGNPGLEVAKRRFDDAGHTLVLNGAAQPLVAVIRPPWQDSSSWGLNVGVKQQSGQIRFSFDDGQSLQLCRRLVQLAADPRQGVQGDTFRRRIDGTVGSNACRDLEGR